MTFCDEYNEEALRIAKEFKAEMQGRVPQQLTQDCMPNKTVLVVGMNPSFNLPWISKRLNRSKEDTEILYSLDSKNLTNRLVEIRAFEQRAFNDHAYFKRIREFLSVFKLQDDWSHLDLFIMRETSQKEALKSVGYKEYEDESLIEHSKNEFRKKQLDLFESALNALRPKIIIVANTAASVIISDRFNDGANKTSFNLNGNFNESPKVFLSGMLGGQRALDRFSRLRLIKEVEEHLRAS